MDYSKSSMKAVFLLSLNGLEIHLMPLLLGSFRITFIDGQKHLKSLLLLPNIVCIGGEHAMFKPFIEKHRVRPHACTREEEAEDFPPE